MTNTERKNNLEAITSIPKFVFTLLYNFPKTGDYYINDEIKKRSPVDWTIPTLFSTAISFATTEALILLNEKIGRKASPLEYVATISPLISTLGINIFRTIEKRYKPERYHEGKEILGITQ